MAPFLEQVVIMQMLAKRKMFAGEAGRNSIGSL